jgi:hypothetical protein
MWLVFDGITKSSQRLRDAYRAANEAGPLSGAENAR